MFACEAAKRSDWSTAEQWLGSAWANASRTPDASSVAWRRVARTMSKMAETSPRKFQLKESLSFCILIEHTFFLKLSDDLYTMQVAMLWEVVGQCALDECVFLGGAIWWKEVLRFSGHLWALKKQQASTYLNTSEV